MMSIDEGSEVAECIDDWAQRTGAHPLELIQYIFPPFHGRYHYHQEFWLGFGRNWSKPADPVARDIGRWARDKYGLPDMRDGRALRKLHPEDVAQFECGMEIKYP